MEGEREESVWFGSAVRYQKAEDNDERCRKRLKTGERGSRIALKLVDW